MAKNSASIRSKNLALEIETILSEFFRKDPIKQLELIRANTAQKNPIRPLVDDLIANFQRYDTRDDTPNKWHDLDGKLGREIYLFMKTHFSRFLYLSVIQAYFDSPGSPIGRDYQSHFKKKHKLTEGQFQSASLKMLHTVFEIKPKHGGSEGFWNEQRKIQLLAAYNRFFIVIKNARRDLRQELRTLSAEGTKSNNELTAKRNVIAKYGIPKELKDSLFLPITPSEQALDWAIAEMKIENPKREYIAKILKDAQRKWKAVNKDRPHILLIDVSFEIGQITYGVSKSDEKGKDELRFSGPSNLKFAKSGNFFDRPYFIGASF